MTKTITKNTSKRVCYISSRAMNSPLRKSFEDHFILILKPKSSVL